MKKTIDLNNGWEFCERWSDGFARGEECGAAAVRLPHTCRETPFDYFDESLYQMECGYRRYIDVPAEWTGKRVFLRIGAAGHYAEVYVDGRSVCTHACGYTAFKCELTGIAVPGKKALISVRVDSRETLDQPPFGYVIDYMTYGGLYREVTLEVTEQTYIEDVFAKPDAASGTVESDIAVRGDYFKIKQSVFEYKSDEKLAESSFSKGEKTVISVPGHKNWSIESPILYTLVTEAISDGGDTVDRVATTIGFRSAEFREDGFYLNGKKVRIVGLNRHQSWPYVGYAMPESQQKLDADILKRELGVNAVRTSHYPQSQHFIDRCDELGLLVFTEIPGWQHIGGAEWKKQAVDNVREMVTQYRNHPSIILWGVRINESRDDDAFYRETNELARRLDPTRQTGGVRCNKKSSLLEDVYTYNDFVYDGTNNGCDPKKAVSSDPSKPYLITEYAGHMFPTKTFDSEDHRTEQALRHATVLDAAAAADGISGSFGWCMFDYNTHKDFGSGDRICYHGVCDMFRNKKQAADVYSVMQDETPVLSVTSTMDIGEHQAGYRGRNFIFTNADSVDMYKNGRLIRKYTHKDSPFKNLARPPIEMNDFVGDQIEKTENFKPRQARYVADIVNYAARFGMNNLPLGIKLKAAWLMLRYRMTFEDAYQLYGKYVGNWGDAATVYRFEAIKDGRTVKTVEKTTVNSTRLAADPDHTALTEGATYDVASVRLRMVDQNGNTLPFWCGAVRLETEGGIEIIGPAVTVLRGGMGGAYIRTRGEAGRARLTLTPDNAESVTIDFDITDKRTEEEI